MIAEPYYIRDPWSINYRTPAYFGYHYYYDSPRSLKQVKSDFLKALQELRDEKSHHQEKKFLEPHKMTPNQLPLRKWGPRAREQRTRRGCFQ